MGVLVVGLDSIVNRNGSCLKDVAIEGPNYNGRRIKRRQGRGVRVENGVSLPVAEGGVTRGADSSPLVSRKSRCQTCRIGGRCLILRDVCDRRICQPHHDDRRNTRGTRISGKIGSRKGVMGEADENQVADDAGSVANKSAKRILIVDDDPEIIEALNFALTTKGYTVMIARDGNQGLAMAEREDPDLVILDMMMPKRSGFLVLEKLRRTRPIPLRIIMITANEGSRHKSYAEMLGVDDYLRKPFAMERLLESVQRLLA